MTEIKSMSRARIVHSGKAPPSHDRCPHIEVFAMCNDGDLINDDDRRRVYVAIVMGDSNIGMSLRPEKAREWGNLLMDCANRAERAVREA